MNPSAESEASFSQALRTIRRTQSALASTPQGLMLPGSTSSNTSNGWREHFGLGQVDELDRFLSPIGYVQMVGIEPISAYRPGVDTHRNSEVRSLFAPLCAVVSKHRVALVAVSHLNEGSGGAAIYRTTGSLGFVAAARACLLVATPEDQPDLRHLLAVNNNPAPMGSGISYRICRTEAGVPYVE